jgi:hypothetical protein
LFFTIRKGIFIQVLLFLHNGGLGVQQNIQRMDDKHMGIVLKLVELFIRRELVGDRKIKGNLGIVYL